MAFIHHLHGTHFLLRLKPAVVIRISHTLHHLVFHSLTHLLFRSIPRTTLPPTRDSLLNSCLVAGIL